MRPIADELAELDAALAELRAAIAAPLRELVIDALLIVSTWRTATIAVLLASGVALFVWFCTELIRALA